MNARYQYLKVLQEQYFQAQSRKEKSSILDEYCRNTGQKVRVKEDKFTHPLKA